MIEASWHDPSSIFDNLLSSQARNSWPKCNWPKRFPAALQKTFCYAVYLM